MWKLRAMKSMSFTVFSHNATVLLIQPNPTQPITCAGKYDPTQPMDGLDPTHVHLCPVPHPPHTQDVACGRPCGPPVDVLKVNHKGHHVAMRPARQRHLYRSSLSFL